ncbi:unnamed protein product [Adineta steineri]|uniref:Uncharacterized protein n=3 Tax=Adineta steineri TaxID=433720 RepID=A0A814GZX2_9BILA|nr:unnamed protein product [Adineta steineri]
MIELVGTTLQTDAMDSDVPCIGFCNWKRISASSHGKPDNHRTPPQYNQMDITPIDDCELESNHTHFVLFDDEIDNVENIQLKRGEIERQLSKTLLGNKTVNNEIHSKSVFRNTVPIVTLLLGGNITTLVVICEGLQNEIPVVAILGTGHLADIVAALCYDLRSYHELTHKQFNDYPDLKKKLEEKKEKDIQECKLRLKELGRLEGKDTDQIDDKINKCVKILEDMNTLIAVYDGVKCIDNLEDVIADAMWNEISYHRKNKETVKDGYDPRAEELKWCLIWNKEARGELEIWINSGDENLALAETKRRWVSKLGQSALFEALCRNKVSFVNLLMDNGASIEAFEINDLQIICKKAMNDDALPLDWPPRHLHASNDSKKLLENMHRAYLIQYLGYYVKKEHKTGKKPTIEELVVWNHNPKHHWKYSIGTLFDENKTETLYLWFLFMNRPDMAKCLCSTISNQTVAILLAATIYFKASENDNENRRSLINIGKQFDGHSKNLIDECFVQDKSLAISVLECKAPALYHCTPLDVARRTDCRGFLASDTVQAHLDQKWYHHFDTHQTLLKLPIYTWICIVSLFLPLIPISAVIFPFLYKKSAADSKIWNKEARGELEIWINSGDENLALAETKRRWVSKLGQSALFEALCRNKVSFVNLLMDNGASIEAFEINDLQIICKKAMNDDALPLDWPPRHLHASNDPKKLLENMHNSYLIQYLGYYVKKEHKTRKKPTIEELVLWNHNPKHDWKYSIVTSWSLLTTSNQVNWTYAGDGSLYNVTVMNGGSDLWTWQLLRDVSNWGIWKVFGQTDEPYNGVVSGNDVYGTFVYLLAIAFVLISNILLVNVLIAMFNVTIQRILDRSRIIWRHQRFLLIYEYSERPVLPAPLNVCYYPVKFIIYLWRLFCCERPCVSSRVTQSTGKTKDI